VSKHSSSYPRLAADGSGSGVVSQAGAVLLLRTAETVGLTSELSQALARWRKPLAVHDPGKIVLDLAVAVALGGDCLADIGMLRAEPGVFGRVASDPTVSRMITTLAAEAPQVLAAIGSARAAARATAWDRAGEHAPDHRMTPTIPWSSIWTRPCWMPIPTRNTRHRRSRRATASTRWARGPTTAPRAPANPWPSCCGRVTPAPTPPSTISGCWPPRWINSPFDPGIGLAGRCWCAPIPVAAPMSSCGTATNDGCNIPSGSL
jgi:hypothetical protein